MGTLVRGTVRVQVLVLRVQHSKFQMSKLRVFSDTCQERQAILFVQQQHQDAP